MYLYKSPLNAEVLLFVKCSWIIWRECILDILLWRAITDEPKSSFFVCFFLPKKNGCSLWFTISKQDTDRHCATTHRPHSIVPIPRLSSLLSLHPSFADTRWCILSLSTHASLAHTPLPLLLRGGTAVSEQALPLHGADRALIWRLILRKRLIKGDRWERGRGLSRQVKASQLSGLIGQGASGQLLGRDWVTWWLFFHTVAGCIFTHSLPWVCSHLMNSTLRSAEFS